jgi:hypothetical protein
VARATTATQVCDSPYGESSDRNASLMREVLHTTMTEQTNTESLADHLNTVTVDDGADNLPERAVPNVEKYFSTMKTYVRMAARKEQNAVIVKGRPGIAKSYEVEQVLQDETTNDESPCWEYTFKQGYVSPMSLYEALYEAQADGHVLVLDDASGIADNDTAAALLKAALEGQGSGDERIVQWDTKSSRLGEDVPQKFRFRGTIVMIFNDVPDGNEHFRAVKSRAMDYHLQLTFDERMDLIREIAKAPYEGLTYDERMDVASWLIRHTTSEMDHVDLRSLFKCFDLYKSSVIDGDEWKLHAGEQLGISKAQMIATDIATDCDSLVTAAKRFADETHHPTERFFEVMGEDTEAQLARELDTKHDVARDAIDEWEQLTEYGGKATFYRRLDAL